jgi:hypothetical protein
MGVADGVLVIEWADRLAHEMAGAWHVSLEIVSDTERRITVASWQPAAGSQQ